MRDNQKQWVAINKRTGEIVGRIYGHKKMAISCAKRYHIDGFTDPDDLDAVELPRELLLSLVKIQAIDID